MPLIDSASYQNYTDKRGEYVYRSTLKKEFYMNNEYDIERCIICMMFKDKLLNARVYNQLHREINRKQLNAHFKYKVYVALFCYLLVSAYIYMNRH